MADARLEQAETPRDDWEKYTVAPEVQRSATRSGRWRFLVLGLALLGAIAYLMLSGTGIGARYYTTIEELLNDQSMWGKKVRISGAVVGDPVFSPETNELHFVVANIPNDNDAIREQGGLALVLHNAVINPDVPRLQVVAHDKEIPDLLQNEAQAIMAGRLEMVDGEPVFYADEINLKCPTKYEESVPEQVVQ